MSADRRLAAMALHPASQDRSTTLSDESLRAIAAGLGSVVDTHLAEPARSVQRTRMLATPAYDVWLMTWGPSSSADPHDHAGSVGVVHVVAGELSEDASDVHGGARHRRQIPAGVTTTLSAIGRHTLANRTDRTAVSVHVYSPPLGDPHDG
ncbi:cysteine dioxygenase [Dermatobacter hominis]|uniref:cysteine dioxygenase n=1 Tax=Dermatobacter hominis TaxID=2884263 RepID=UPI001D107383|nr:cysteine dioxygenase family protein [Dermatobacter hominis]UDY34255.1 cysteine dioxygenase family protein [Dermatobacter hominis]